MTDIGAFCVDKGYILVGNKTPMDRREVSYYKPIEQEILKRCIRVQQLFRGYSSEPKKNTWLALRLLKEAQRIERTNRKHISEDVVSVLAHTSRDLSLSPTDLTENFDRQTRIILFRITNDTLSYDDDSGPDYHSVGDLWMDILKSVKFREDELSDDTKARMNTFRVLIGEPMRGCSLIYQAMYNCKDKEAYFGLHKTMHEAFKPEYISACTRAWHEDGRPFIEEAQYEAHKCRTCFLGTGDYYPGKYDYPAKTPCPECKGIGFTGNKVAEGQKAQPDLPPKQEWKPTPIVKTLTPFEEAIQNGAIEMATALLTAARDRLAEADTKAEEKKALLDALPKTDIDWSKFYYALNESRLADNSMQMNREGVHKAKQALARCKGGVV